VESVAGVRTLSAYGDPINFTSMTDAWGQGFGFTYNALVSPRKRAIRNLADRFTSIDSAAFARRPTAANM